ncbi:MAG TPA: hypothetical protein PKA82_07515 [Pyrinomonadaceae bacterium]|nr:hypothetical protein [Pyrinomonadaceae bacterium]
MLKRSFVSFAIIVSGLFLANQAYGQSSQDKLGNFEIQVRQSNTSVQPRRSNNARTCEVVGANKANSGAALSSNFVGTDEELAVVIRQSRTRNRTSNLMKFDTGEISIRSTGNGRVRGLIDTSTGEIVW